MALFAGTLLSFLVISQGGYYPIVTSAIGVLVATGTCFLRARDCCSKGLPQISALLVLLVAFCLVSAIVNGPTLTTLAMTGFWAATSSMSLLASSFSEETREKTLKLIAWSGVILAVFGVLTVAGVISFYGSLAGERLDFTFQYANATGVWFGVCVLLCLASGDAWLHRLSALPVLCLLLTESGGVAATFSMVALFVGVCWAKNGRWKDLLRALFAGAFALCAFELSRTVSPILALAASGVWVLVIRQCEESNIIEGQEKRICIVLLFVLAGCALAAAFSLHVRIVNAAGNLVERYYHVKDAIVLWSTSPFFGVGPDMWQYLYPHYQSAQYVTKVVHCSYAQVLVDAGLLGFVLLVTACVVGMRDLMKRARTKGGLAEGEAAAAALIVLHSIVDFDLRFGAISLLLALLFTVPDGKRAVPSKGLVLWCCVVPCLALCLTGGFADMCLIAMETENLSGDYSGCVSLYERNPLARRDPGATAECLNALVQLGDDPSVVELVMQIEQPTDEEAVYGCLSLYRLGRQREAGELLISQLEAQPYNYQLFVNASSIFDTYGLDQSLRGRYIDTIERANELVDAANPLLPRQRRIVSYL